MSTQNWPFGFYVDSVESNEGHSTLQGQKNRGTETRTRFLLKQNDFQGISVKTKDFQGMVYEVFNE